MEPIQHLKNKFKEKIRNNQIQYKKNYFFKIPKGLQIKLIMKIKNLKMKNKNRISKVKN